MTLAARVWRAALALAAAALLMAGGAMAQVADLTRDERRAVQAALARAGIYDGLIDGAFGARSQAALDAWHARTGGDLSASLTRLMLDYAAVWDAEGWAEVPVPGLAQRFVAPFGLMKPLRQVAADHAWFAADSRIVLTVHRESPGAMRARHDTVAYLARPGTDRYVQRRETLWITAVDTGTGTAAQRHYMRSLRVGGTFETISVKVRAGDEGLLMLIAGSIATGRLALPVVPAGGALAVPAPRPVPTSRLVTGIAVSDIHILTATAPLDGCAALADAQDEPLTLVAVDDGGQLALLRGAAPGGAGAIALGSGGALPPGLVLRLGGVQGGGMVLSMPARVAAARAGVFVAGDPGALDSAYLTGGRFALATQVRDVAPGWAVTGADGALAGVVLSPPDGAPTRPLLVEGAHEVQRFLHGQGVAALRPGDPGTVAAHSAIRSVTCRP
jgi:serine protease Do